MRRCGGTGVASRVYFSAELPLPFPALPPCRPVIPRRPVTRIAVHSSRPPAAHPSSKREMMNRTSKSRAFPRPHIFGIKHDIQLSQKQILAQRTVLLPHCARRSCSISNLRTPAVSYRRVTAA